MTPTLKMALIDAATKAIADHADALTALDQAIGDGDHGINLKRGFEAIWNDRDEIAALAYDEALHKAGMTLVMTVGGASGPLYGSLLMGMAKAAKAGQNLEGQLAEGIAMVKKTWQVGDRRQDHVRCPGACSRYLEASPQPVGG